MIHERNGHILSDGHLNKFINCFVDKRPIQAGARYEERRDADGIFAQVVDRGKLLLRQMRHEKIQRRADDLA